MYTSMSEIIPYRRSTELIQHHAFLPKRRPSFTDGSTTDSSSFNNPTDEEDSSFRQPVTEVLTFGGGGDIGVLLRGPNDTDTHIRPVPKLSKRCIIDITCSPFSSLALTNNGEIYVGGLNEEGQLAPDLPEQVLTQPTLVESLATQRILGVSAGEHHIGVVNSNQQPLTFGSNEYNALGHTFIDNNNNSNNNRTNPYRILPRVMKNLGSIRVVQVACGNTHTLVLSRDGTVYTVGAGGRGALGLGNREDYKETQRIHGLVGVPITQIAAGDNYSLAVSATGLAYGWGMNKYGQLGLPTKQYPYDILTPTIIHTLPELVQLTNAGEAHSGWISKSGRLYMSGRNGHGQLGLGYNYSSSGTSTASIPNVNDDTEDTARRPLLYVDEPTHVTALGNKRVREVACGARHTLILTVDGYVYSTGDCSDGATGVQLNKYGLVNDTKNSTNGRSKSPMNEGKKVTISIPDTVMNNNETKTVPSSTDTSIVSPSPSSALRSATVSSFAELNPDVPLLDLQHARDTCLWKPTCIPQLSGIGVFRIATAGSHSMALRVTYGSVLSTQPGSLPRGIMIYVDTNTVTLLARNSARTANYAMLKGVLRDVFAHVHNVNGSFLLNNEALLVQARSILPSTVPVGPTPTRRPSKSENGSKSSMNENGYSPYGETSKQSWKQLTIENDHRMEQEREDYYRTQITSLSSSSSSSSGEGSSNVNNGASNATDDGTMEEEPMSPVIAAQHPLRVAPDTATDTTIEISLASPKTAKNESPDAIVLPVKRRAIDSDTDMNHATNALSDTAATTMTEVSSSSDDTSSTYPPLRLKLRKDTSDNEENESSSSTTDNTVSFTGTKDSSTNSVTLPSAVPRTPLGLSSTAAVQLAPVQVGLVVPTSAVVESSGIDIQGVEKAYLAIMQTYDTEILNELSTAAASLVDELDAIAPSLQHMESLRAFIILWMNPLNLRPSLTSVTIARMCHAILTLPQSHRDLLFEWIGIDVPGVFFASRLIKPLQEHLTYHAKNLLLGNGDDIVYSYTDNPVNPLGKIPAGGSTASTSSSSGSSTANRSSSSSSSSSTASPHSNRNFWNMGGSNVGNTSSSSSSAPSSSTSTTKSLTVFRSFELIIRVLRLCYNLNEKLMNDTQNALDKRTSIDLSSRAGQRMDRLIRQMYTSSEFVVNQGLDVSSAPLGALVPPDVFYNAAISNLHDGALAADFRKWKDNGYKRVVENISLCGYPFLFNPATKRRVFAIEANSTQQAEANNAMARSMNFNLFGMNTGGNIPGMSESPYFVIHVRRSNLLSDTLNQLAQTPVHNLRKQLKVVFADEDGIDQGGVTKEFFQLLIKEIFDEKYGMWKSDPETRTHWFNPGCPSEMSMEFVLIGILVGLAIYNGTLLDIHFPLALYKKLLKLPVHLYDLRGLNPSVANSLQTLINYPHEDVEDVFCLDWTATYEAFGEAVTVDLVPNGKDIPVTSKNRIEYVNRYVDWLLNKSIESSYNQFAKGFHMAVSGHTLQLCRPEELELLVTGTPHLDFHALEQVTSYEGGYSKDHPTIKLFWKVVHGLPEDLKMKLLMFATGSAKAPIGGLGKLVFRIQRNGPDSDMLPTASTCFNTLLLPNYSTEQRLKERLTIAISECTGFGLK